MPYTKKEDREKFEPELKKLIDKIKKAETAKGDLTYLVYVITLEYIKSKGKSYTNISSAISSLQDAAEEMRRQVLNPYEDEKIKENGGIE